MDSVAVVFTWDFFGMSVFESAYHVAWVSIEIKVLLQQVVCYLSLLGLVAVGLRNFASSVRHTMSQLQKSPLLPKEFHVPAHLEDP